MQKNQTNEHLLEEPLLETYKRSCILIGINISDAAAAAVSVFVCVRVCVWWGGQSKAKMWTLELHWSRSLFTLFSLVCLWRAEASLSGLSQPSTAHSLLIYRSLSLLLSSANYSRGPCDCCLSHLTLHCLALMSLSTRKSRGPSLNRAEGDYVTACLWGWNIFFF